MEEDEDIKEARKVLEQISQDEREREKARLRDKYVREMNSSRNEGYALGKADGKAEGKAEGRASEKVNIAKNLLKQKVDIEIVIKCTGLTKEEVENLIAEM